MRKKVSPIKMSFFYVYFYALTKKKNNLCEMSVANSYITILFCIVIFTNGCVPLYQSNEVRKPKEPIPSSFTHPKSDVIIIPVVRDHYVQHYSDSVNIILGNPLFSQSDKLDEAIKKLKTSTYGYFTLLTGTVHGTEKHVVSLALISSRGELLTLDKFKKWKNYSKLSFGAINTLISIVQDNGAVDLNLFGIENLSKQEAKIKWNKKIREEIVLFLQGINKSS